MEKANNPYKLSPATLRALERFGPDKSSNRSAGNRLEPLPLPGADWELWAHMPKATLTEAVAVSLGIDPSGIKRGGGYAEPGIEFDRRLKLASAFVNDAGPLRPIGLGAMYLIGGPVTAVVSLPEFAKWALGMGWTLPEKFPRFKAELPPALAIRNPVAQAIMHAALQRVGQGSAQNPNTVPVVTPAQTSATPAPVAVVELGEPYKAGPGWSLKTSIERAPGYRWPLYQVLKAAHLAGQPCPNARDVLHSWTLKPPPDVQVMPDGVKYNDGLGNLKEANLKAIQQAIKNLLKPRAGQAPANRRTSRTWAEQAG